MRVTYNWLKDFVEIKIAPQALAEMLTMAGLEVTSLEEKEGDFVFELEVTTNRPDWLSVVGIAREVAAITGRQLKLPKLVHSPQSIVHSSGKEKIYGLSTIDYRLLSIKIESKKDCPLYIARIIRNVKVGPSPDWIKKRLELIGCRSINNVVDITNYVLFEQGEPLHAFDLDKLAQSAAIFVRRGKNGEKITTIDGEQKLLNPDILVIADKERPVALAGIMGGKDSEVSVNTKNILLEAAVFNPVTVRHGRQKLGLESESAYRFERGIDLEIVESASRRAAQLLMDLTGGECILAKSSAVIKRKKGRVILNIPGSNKILGVSIRSAGIKKILESLGFKTRPKGKDDILVKVPSYRGDVEAQIDLIEELARLYGFDKIPTTLPSVRPRIIPDRKRELVSAIKNTLIGLGLNEVISYSLVDKELLQNFMPGIEKDALEILNPLSKEQEFLRPHLIPSLALCIARNLNYKQDYVNIFEAAKVFCASSTQAKEELMLGIALCGTKPYLFELQEGMVRGRFGFLHLKGILESLFGRVGITNYSFNPTKEPSVISICVGSNKIGELVFLRKEFLDKLDIKNKEVVAAQISLEKLFSHVKPQKTFVPPPRYPGITRDISLVFKEEVSLQEALQAAAEKGRPLLCSIKVTDYYRGSQIPAGSIGLTISCFYRSDERTLSEAEINPVHNQICELLTQAFGAKVR